MNPHLTDQWDDDPHGSHGDVAGFVPGFFKLRLWHVALCVVVLSLLIGATAACGFRASLADHASDRVAAFAVSSADLTKVPAEQIIQLVNDGQLGFDPMLDTVYDADPLLARKLKVEWDEVRSLTIRGRVSLEKITAISKKMSEAHKALRDVGERLRRWTVLLAFCSVLLLGLSAWFGWIRFSKGTEQIVIQKLIVQQRQKELVRSETGTADEWVFDAGRRHFENTFARLPVACCSFSNDGKITAWNRAMEDTTGHSEGDVLQMSFWEVMQWDKLGDLGQNAMYRLLQGEPVDVVDWQYEHPVGELLDFRATLIPVSGATGGMVSAVAAISDVTLQRRQERMLIENDVTKTAMLAAIPDTLMRLDREGRLLDLKDNAGLIQVPAIELLGDVGWQQVVGKGLGDAIMSSIRAARNSRGNITVQYHSLDADERHLDIRVAMCGPSDVLAILHDTTDRYRAETLMRDSEARLRYLIEGSADVLTLVDTNGNISYQSPAVQQVLGYDENELVGRPLTQLVQEDERPSVSLAILQLKSTEGGKTRFYAQMPHKAGGLRDLEIYGRNLLSNKYVNAIVLNVRDVTERKGLERELQRRVMEVQAANSQLEDANKVLAQRATTDGLTGLRNHRTSQEYLTAAVAHCQKRGLPVSLAVIDVDYFKRINDTQGHQEGDRVLQWLAVMVQKACRHLHLAGRYGGEEFVLVMPETDATTAYAETERLRSAIETGCDRGYSVTVSIGLVTSDSVLETSASLFATADRALYASKQGGRNRVTAVDQCQSQAA